MLPIIDITNFTLQDYPEHTACIIWFGGCNLRCRYCQNPDLVLSTQSFIPETKILNFLKKRTNLIEGVVLSGGECTLNRDLISFVEEIKKINFKIKIDTNGLNFNIIHELVENNLIDFVALDFKAPRDKFKLVTQYDRYNDFEKTLVYLAQENNKKNIDLEVRTTVHTDLLQETDINAIILELKNLNFRGNFCIQNFRNDNNKILTPMQPQVGVLEKNLIQKPIGFNIIYRNFFD